ncbi:hypothetical protein YQE_05488, partial [Dendroctonus ponderosae]
MAWISLGGVRQEQFDLLCKDGSRRPLSDFENCNWGLVPSDAIVVSSAVSFETREKFQAFLQEFAKRYGKNGPRHLDSPDQREPELDNFGNRLLPTQDRYNARPNQPEYDPYNSRNVQRFRRQNYVQDGPDYETRNTLNGPERNYSGGTDGTYYEHFDLFESTPRYGEHGNLLFQVLVANEPLYLRLLINYDSARDIVPVPENLQTYEAFLGKSHEIIMEVRKCPVNRMTMCVTSDEEKNKCVKMRTALKAQLLKPELDCYKGYSQIHCMQAIRGAKNTCHGGINTAAGWVYPMAYLISNGWIRSYGCNSIRAAAEYFTKSCVPGAISTEYNTGVPYDNMCDLCHGASFRYCKRDASEDYYGHTGAFRCLVEGGGDVAFVKHTTVFENTGGKKREWWVRDNLMEDFELLCPDGTRAEANEYRKCNLGKIKSNAIVTRGGYGYNETQIDAYINLFMYAQTFYGRKTRDDFSMFMSDPPHSDLIFQDATTQLKVIPASQRYYSVYLGSDFMRARRIVDCNAGSGSIFATIALTILSCALLIEKAHSSLWDFCSLCSKEL